MMEKKLSQAFDLQRFAPNAHSHARMSARELADDELELVAGGRQLPQQPEDGKK